jgi:hypothetical protein
MNTSNTTTIKSSCNTLPAPELSEDQLIKRIKTHIEKGDQAKGRAEQAGKKAEEHYTAAGIHLKALRDGSPSKAAWEELIKSRCGLGASRAYELIAIADGRKTVADVRLGKAESMRKLRSRPPRGGQNLSASRVEADESYIDPPLKKPLPDCPICEGSGTAPMTISTACGFKISETQDGFCSCRLREERRGNRTLYEDLKQLAAVREERSKIASDAPSTEREPAATTGEVGGGVQAAAPFHDLDAILHMLTNRSNGVPKAERIGAARRILRALRITAQDLMPPETGRPPRHAAPTYRCNKTVDALPASAPTSTATGTADDYPDMPPSLIRAPKDAAAS